MIVVQDNGDTCVVPVVRVKGQVKPSWLVLGLLVCSVLQKG